MKSRSNLITEIRTRIHEGTERKKGVYNTNYQAFANILWHHLNIRDKDLKNYVDNPKVIHSAQELERLKGKIDRYIPELVDWSIKQNKIANTSGPFNSRQIDQIYVSLHNEFVEQMILLHDIKKVKIKEGDLFYRGIPSAYLSEKDIQNSWDISHMAIEKGAKQWFIYKIRTRWWDTERNTKAVATSTDPSMGLKYSHARTKNGGWIFIIRPPEGAEAVSLAPYRSRGSNFREIDFSNIPTEWIKEAIHVKSDKKGMFVDKILPNPNYRNNGIIENKFSGENLLHKLHDDQSLRLVETTSIFRKIKNFFIHTIHNRKNIDIGGLLYFNYDIVDQSGKVVEHYKAREEDLYFKHRFRKSDDTSKRKPKYKNREVFENNYTAQDIALRRCTAPIDTDFPTAGKVSDKTETQTKLITDLIVDLSKQIRKDNNNFDRQSDLIDKIEAEARKEQIQYVNPSDKKYDYKDASGTRIITWLHPKCIVGGKIDLTSPYADKKYQIVYKIAQTGKITVEYGKDASAVVLVKPDTDNNLSAAIVNIDRSKDPEIIQGKSRFGNNITSIECLPANGFAARQLMPKSSFASRNFS
jgi:hypothetical protein